MALPMNYFAKLCQEVGKLCQCDLNQVPLTPKSTFSTILLFYTILE